MMAEHTMRAVRVYGYGGPEQLKLERIECPAPQAGEVLLRVHAVGVNSIDWKIRQGLMKGFQPITFPYIPGIEVARQSLGEASRERTLNISPSRPTCLPPSQKP
jgi:D-arabinose 1-dehydrogenase-like Zn-dependent alcohol dehydrogenase